MGQTVTGMSIGLNKVVTSDAISTLLATDGTGTNCAVESASTNAPKDPSLIIPQINWKLTSKLTTDTAKMTRIV